MDIGKQRRVIEVEPKPERQAPAPQRTTPDRSAPAPDPERRPEPVGD